MQQLCTSHEQRQDVTNGDIDQPSTGGIKCSTDQSKTDARRRNEYSKYDDDVGAIYVFGYCVALWPSREAIRAIMPTFSAPR